MRDAENGEAFLGEIEWSYGFTTRLLSGEEEAAMMIRGVAAGRPPLDDTLRRRHRRRLDRARACGARRGRLLDEPRRRMRADHGALPRVGPADTGGARGAGAEVRALLPSSNAARAIGVAGTITTLATLDLGDDEYDPERTHGHRIARAAVEEQLDRLAA